MKSRLVVSPVGLGLSPVALTLAALMPLATPLLIAIRADPLYIQV